MSITLDQIILDAQRIANRVKDLEALGNALLVEAEGNNRQIETMKQFQDDIDSLNKLTRDKSNADMVNRVNQQNPSLREFRQENRELKATLEDHQRALELIMHKYREHIQHKIFTSRVNFKELYNAKLQGVIQTQQEKITEMAGVMQKAAAIDDDIVHNEIELITKLQVENQGLREMLQISKQFDKSTAAGVRATATAINHCESEDKAVQTETEILLQQMLENGGDSIETEKIRNEAVANLLTKSLAPLVKAANTTETILATPAISLASVTTIKTIEEITPTAKTEARTFPDGYRNVNNVEIEPNKLTPSGKTSPSSQSSLLPEVVPLAEEQVS